MSKKKPVRYEGAEYDVFWNGSLCMHMGECVHDETDLFVKGRKPWAEPDLVDPGCVLDVVKRCPSGALSCASRAEEPDESAETVNSVTVSANGPLYIRGDVEIEGADESMPGVQFRAALCRCGHSRRKPFCDNSHVKEEFTDSGSVGKAGPGLETEGGKLTVTGRENGPLLLSGNFSITSSAGRTTWKGTKVALCRCGHSAKKPFCDGAHRFVDFKTD